MPSSDPANIGLILEIVRKLQPTTILDLGVGCGKFGVLFREYLDGHWNKRAFHDKETWKTVIIGMEICAKYITPVHKYVYNEMVICDAYEWLTKHNHLGTFDLVFMGDFIEHFPKWQGDELIKIIRDRWLAPKGVILVTTPNFETRINDERLAIFGNKHEVHRCRWDKKDFMNLGMEPVFNINRHIIVELHKK